MIRYFELRHKMRNIARFLFRILSFYTSCEKKKTAGGALRLAIYQTHSEISWGFNFEMGMVQSRGDAPYPFCLVIEEVLFHFFKRDFVDCDVRTLHILSDEFCHPRITGNLAEFIRIELQTFFETFETCKIAIEK